MFYDLKYKVRSSFRHYEKQIINTIASLFGLTFIYVCIMSVTQGCNSELNLWLASGKGAVALTLCGGFFFYYVGFYYDEKEKKRAREIQIRMDNYNWMIEFLNNGSFYEFETPDYKDEEGCPFLYTLVPAKVDGKNVFFDNSISLQYVLTVKDISYRNTCSESRIKDYISGPLKVGNSYYIRFLYGKWRMDTYPDGVAIIPNSKCGGCHNLPSPQKLVIDQQYQERFNSLSLFGNLLFDDAGDFSNTGQIGKAFFEQSTKKTFIQLGENGILREFFITYAKNDHLKKDPFIVIEKVEGFFKSSIALLNFKNNLSDFCSKKSITIREVEFWNASKFKGQ